MSGDSWKGKDAMGASEKRSVAFADVQDTAQAVEAARLREERAERELSTSRGVRKDAVDRYKVAKVKLERLLPKTVES